MPFDGVLTNCIATELHQELAGARVDKIHMPEKHELVLALRTLKGSCKLLLNANSTMARVQLTTVKKENPTTPPMFCMLLRKYLTGGRILSVASYGFERVIVFEIESSNELGDLSNKKLIIEIMGKHSNIVLVHQNGSIIDSIFHVDASMSSKREVMPARPYEWPPSQNKIPPAELVESKVLEDLKSATGRVDRVILNMILGFSPILVQEVCFRANVFPKHEVESLENASLIDLAGELIKLVSEIRSLQLFPAVYFKDRRMDDVLDYHCVRLTHLDFFQKFASINHVLDFYFHKKVFEDKLNQSKQTLMKVVSTNQDRCVRKLALQEQSMRDASDFDHNREVGDLITANIHALKQGEVTVHLQNFYSEQNETIEINLDENLSPQKNAQRYYKKYSKLKKTFEQSTLHARDTMQELDYLATLEEAINQAMTQDDLTEVRLELASQGYLTLPKKKEKRSAEAVSPPNEYLSSDGFTIYAGKNNRQNDLLTLKSSKADDFWLHTQKIPGSHVIIKTSGKTVPSRTIEEAAIISAWHSRARDSSKVPVDYALVRNVKKPPGAKPGMVIYDKFKTIIVSPDALVIKKMTITK
ncbi:MAG: NFACT RNA binding domain-containing protein [Clostridia bacterium]